MITVHPVGRSLNVMCPTVIPGTVVMLRVDDETAWGPGAGA
jgi:hypothetical protein